MIFVPCTLFRLEPRLTFIFPSCPTTVYNYNARPRDTWRIELTGPNPGVMDQTFSLLYVGLAGPYSLYVKYPLAGRNRKEQALTVYAQAGSFQTQGSPHHGYLWCICAL